MAQIKGTPDWSMDAVYHKFPDYKGTNTVVIQILKFLKEYDEKCADARADMFKEIYDLLKIELPKK
jgi:hypothetical protein